MKKKEKIRNDVDHNTIFVSLIICLTLVAVGFLLFGEGLMHKDSKNETIVVGDSIYYNFGEEMTFTQFVDSDTIELSKKYHRRGTEVFTYDIKKDMEIKLPDSDDILFINNIDYNERNITVSVHSSE